MLKLFLSTPGRTRGLFVLKQDTESRAETRFRPAYIYTELVLQRAKRLGQIRQNVADVFRPYRKPHCVWLYALIQLLRC